MCCGERPAALAIAALLLAPAPPPPPPPPRYTAGQLECARFRERARSDIRTSVGGRDRHETGGQEGRWVLRAAPGGDGVRVEGWFDSLAVWRTSEEGTLRPDTDGLIGGRYRGALSPDGRYRADALPFVPDEVGAVAELAHALDDLLPRLPPVPLAVGESWRDSTGLEIRRVADSSGGSGEMLLRFRLTDRREASEVTPQGDSVPIPVHQVSREEGSFVWHPRDGLLRRDRRVAVETTIPPGGRIRRAVRSRVEQHLLVERLSADAACRPRNAAPDRTGPR
jgi:hypothetical protein